MAERRAGPFPVHGDTVVAEDGTTWVYLVREPLGFNAHELDAGEWEQLDVPSVSLATTAASADLERAVRKRLYAAMLLWVRAAGVCPWERLHGIDMRQDDPLPTFAAYIARAMLTDCIAETCDGRPCGLSERATQQVFGILGPSRGLRVANMLQRHMAAVRAELAARPLPLKR